MLYQHVSVSKNFPRGMKNRKDKALVSYTAWSPHGLKPPGARGLTVIKLKKNDFTIRPNHDILSSCKLEYHQQHGRQLKVAGWS